MTRRSQLTVTLHLSQKHFFEMIFQDYLLKIFNHHGAFTFTQKLFVSQGKRFSTPWMLLSQKKFNTQSGDKNLPSSDVIEKQSLGVPENGFL